MTMAANRAGMARKLLTNKVYARPLHSSPRQASHSQSIPLTDGSSCATNGRVSGAMKAYCHQQACSPLMEPTLRRLLTALSA